MSSRLPYQSLEFEAAVADGESLVAWEKSQLKHYQQTASQSPQPDNQLACAELALRQKHLSLAEDYLDQVLQQGDEADAHYLKASVMLARGQQAETIGYLQQTLQKPLAQTPDTARLYVLLAQTLLQAGREPAEAAQAMGRGLQMCGDYLFFHTTTRESAAVSAADLHFDIQVFEQTYSWQNTPATLRFCAVATDGEDRVYILENNHKWLFTMDSAGKLVKGMTEARLAGEQLLFPERLWKLMDVAVNQEGQVYVASCGGTIHQFDQAWQSVAQLTHPEGSRRDTVLSLTADTRGNLYVLYLNRPGVHVFSPEGLYVDAFGANTTMPDTTHNYFCGLGMDQQDQLYFYDRCRVQIYNTETWERVETLEVPDAHDDDMLKPDYPLCWNGIAVDGQGYIYLANTYQENVVVLDQLGNSFEMIDRMDQKLGVFSQPGDVALDSQRRLYVVDTGHARVVRRSGNQWQLFLGHPNWTGSVSLG